MNLSRCRTTIQALSNPGCKICCNRRPCGISRDLPDIPTAAALQHTNSSTAAEWNQPMYTNITGPTGSPGRQPLTEEIHNLNPTNLCTTQRQAMPQLGNGQSTANPPAAAGSLTCPFNYPPNLLGI